MKNKITIITVCQNAEKEIERTLESVYYQSYQNIEYIIKDGKSTDKTMEIIDKYKTLFQEKGIALNCSSESDKGIYDAMNTAVKMCGGDWVIFMNAGDAFYDDNVLSDVFMEKDWEKADVLYGHTLYRLTKSEGIIVNHDSDFLNLGWSLCHQSLFVKRYLLEKFPFECQYRIVADYDQILRLKQKNYIFCKVNAIISDVDREGISSKMVYLRYKENNMLRDNYNLDFKKKNCVIGCIKQFAVKFVPVLERHYYVKHCEKRIISYK